MPVFSSKITLFGKACLYTIIGMVSTTLHLDPARDPGSYRHWLYPHHRWTCRSAGSCFRPVKKESFLLPIRLRGKEVADSDLGQNVAWAGRLSFQLAPQAVDVHLQHMALTNVLGSPDVL